MGRISPGVKDAPSLYDTLNILEDVVEQTYFELTDATDAAPGKNPANSVTAALVPRAL